MVSAPPTEAPAAVNASLATGAPEHARSSPARAISFHFSHELKGVSLDLQTCLPISPLCTGCFNYVIRPDVRLNS
eukprot:6212122-Pleurochrysis_carterae.AAC.1